MIPWADVAMMSYLQGVSLPSKVVMADEDIALERIARACQKDGDNTTGTATGGIAYWRKSCRKANYTTNPMNREGWPGGVTGPPTMLNPLGGTGGRRSDNRFDTTQLVFCVVEYSVVAWFQRMSDRNELERQLWLAQPYAPLELDVKCLDDNDAVLSENTFNMKLIGPEEVSYMKQTSEKEKNITLLGLSTTLTVEAPWIATRVDPFVGTIAVTYEEMINGNPVVFNTVTIRGAT